MGYFKCHLWFSSPNTVCLSYPLFPLLVSILTYGEKTVLFFCFSFLVSQGCVKPLCDLLTCSDPRTVSVCLDAIESILESGESFKDAQNSNIYLQRIYECDGIDKIEGLLNHKNIEIYDKAVKILEKYWLKEEEMEEEWQNLQAGFNLRSLTIA